MASDNNSIVIEGMDLQYNSHSDMHHLSLSILTKEIPKDFNDIAKLLGNHYLREKGLNLNLDDILKDHYPEVLI